MYSMLGTLAFALQIAMEAIPNIHLTGMLTIVYTVVFRKRALIPLYIYVFLVGIRWGFSLTWLPYLYVWLFLWGAVMLLPRHLSPKNAMILYPAIGFLHGILFGILYAPAQAILFGLDVSQTIAWVIAGLPWDLTHALGNAAFCTLAFPLSQLMRRLLKRAGRNI